MVITVIIKNPNIQKKTIKTNRANSNEKYKPLIERNQITNNKCQKNQNITPSKTK